MTLRRIPPVAATAAFALSCVCCAPPSSQIAPPAVSTAADAIDVVELSAVTAADRLASGAITSRALTQAYLDRIAKIDKAGPAINAVIEVNVRATDEASALDAERQSGKVRGPLHGLPVLIKDNIDAVGMVNSAGSLALADNRPKEDAFIVARLRAAGAVILGKTNLSEWANFRSTRSTSGWSSRGGQTKNPYVLDRNPCGSSSGTGSAIAASLAAVGVGTETDGSIICPAAVNGLVGLKPTVGLVSRTGIIPISVTQDTAGPMGRSVADVALLMNALAAVDPADPAGKAAEGHVAADYRAGLAIDSLAGKRIGVLRQAMSFHPDVDRSMARSIELLKGAGAEVVDVTLANYNRWNDVEQEAMLYEFKDGLNAYLKSHGAAQGSLEALIAWNKANADRIMPFFGQEIFEQAQKKGGLTDAAYIKARDTKQRLAGRDGLLATLEKQKLDAILTPSVSPAWPTDHVLGDHFVGAGYSVAAVAGTPSLTVPAGDSHGLPIGVTLMGRPYREADLLTMGALLERLIRGRTPPQYKSTVE
jgi:amidase